MKKNVVIEGLQGTGKSTLLNALAREWPEYHVYREGDLSPIELAWCSYLSREIWEEMQCKYPALQEEIQQKTREEKGRYIVAYTRILAEDRTFYQDMEQYEIYNGRVDFQTFHDIIIKRYRAFSGEGNLFECSFLQNSIESMMLFYQMRDEEILAFYEEAYGVLKEKGFRLVYLDSGNIRENLLHIKKERSDENGNEMWYPLMLSYLKESPYGKNHGYEGFEDLVKHLERRRELEMRILEEIVKEDGMILESKSFSMGCVPDCCLELR